MAEPGGDLPPELRAFLHSCVESLEQVEILMMLRGSQQVRTAREVGQALRVPAAAARRDLETMAARGLLEIRVAEESGFRYRPKSDELGRYCDLLAEHYIVSRQSVLGFVASASRRSIKRFADAFKLRGPEK